MAKASYRPSTEPIRTAEYEVAEISDDATARQFITLHHYSRTYPAARFRVGLYRHGEFAGVAVFSHPCSNAVNVAIRRQLPASLPYPKSLDPFTPLCKKRAPHSR